MLSLHRFVIDSSLARIGGGSRTTINTWVGSKDNSRGSQSNKLLGICGPVCTNHSKNICFSFSLTHYHTMPHFDTIKICSCGKHCGKKGEMACNKPFLLFSYCFQPYIALILHFQYTLKCRLQFVAIWTSLKFCRLVMD